MHCSLTILSAFLLATFVAASYDALPPSKGGLLAPGVAKRELLSPGGHKLYEKRGHRKHRKHGKHHGKKKHHDRKKDGLNDAESIGQTDEELPAASGEKPDASGEKPDASGEKPDASAASIPVKAASNSDKAGGAAAASLPDKKVSDAAAVDAAPVKKASDSVKNASNAERSDIAKDF